MSEFELSIPFVAREQTGSVRASVRRNDAPLAVGSPAWAADFPVCHAVVDFDGAGYDAFFGWVQLVRMGSPDGETTRAWVADPLEIYDGLDTPFGFYGIKPDLYDAPARSDRSWGLDWYAESFLCFAPSSPMSREVRPVAAFGWGFVLVDGDVRIIELAHLPLSEWIKHHGLLASKYGTGTFQPAQ